MAANDDPSGAVYLGVGVAPSNPDVAPAPPKKVQPKKCKCINSVFASHFEKDCALKSPANFVKGLEFVGGKIAKGTVAVVEAIAKEEEERKLRETEAKEAARVEALAKALRAQQLLFERAEELRRNKEQAEEQFNGKIEAAQDAENELLRANEAFKSAEKRLQKAKKGKGAADEAADAAKALFSSADEKFNEAMDDWRRSKDEAATAGTAAAVK
jgi:hypothetical protein